MLRQGSDTSPGRRLLSITYDMERALRIEDYEGFHNLLERRNELIEGIQSFDTEERHLVEELLVIDRRMRAILASRIEDIKGILKVLQKKKKLLKTYLSRG